MVDYSQLKRTVVIWVTTTPDPNNPDNELPLSSLCDRYQGYELKSHIIYCPKCGAVWATQLTYLATDKLAEYTAFPWICAGCGEGSLQHFIPWEWMSDELQQRELALGFERRRKLSAKPRAIPQPTPTKPLTNIEDLL